ncbi:MAG: hypothetical protein HY659_13590 [Rhizobiales bacterium]|nr:hypothetical protein [Hyphomicrobiales bacterium]
MSTVTNRPIGPNDPLYYAPKWALEGEVPKRPEPQPSAPLSPAIDRDPFERARARVRGERPVDERPVTRLRHSPSLEPALTPELLPEPKRKRTDYWLKLFARVMLVAVAAQAAAIVAVGFPSLNEIKPPILDRIVASIFPVSPASPVAKSRKLEAPLLLGDGATGAVDEPLPLGITLRGKAESGFVLIGNLATDASVSNGQRMDASTWRLSVDELASAFIVPPHGYSGAMDIGVDLRLPDNAIVARRVVRMQWTTPPEAAVPATVHLDAPPRQLDSEEVAGLLKRGEQLVVTGDLSGARLLLRRAAEAHDARAALALAATYDPLVIRKLGVYGFKPDAEKAREWYEKAKAYGSAEAGKRLEHLAAQTR